MIGTSIKSINEISVVNIDDIYVQGISCISTLDIKCAHEFGYRIKLLAISKFDGQAIDVRVHPAMIPENKPMANVNGVLNAIMVCEDLMEENIQAVAILRTLLLMAKALN